MNPKEPQKVNNKNTENPGKRPRDPLKITDFPKSEDTQKST